MTGRKSIMVDAPIWNKIDRYRHDTYVRSIGSAIENAVDIASSEEKYVCIHRTQVTKSAFLNREKVDIIMKVKPVIAALLNVDFDEGVDKDDVNSKPIDELLNQLEEYEKMIFEVDSEPTEDTPFLDCVIAFGRTVTEVIQKVEKINPDAAMEIKLYDEVDTEGEEEYFVIKCSSSLSSETCYLDFYNKYHVPLTCSICGSEENFADIENRWGLGCYAIITSMDNVRMIGPSLGHLLEKWDNSSYSKKINNILIARCSSEIIREYISSVDDYYDPIYYITGEPRNTYWDSFDEEKMCIKTTPSGKYYAGVVYWDNGDRTLHSIGKTANSAMKNGTFINDGMVELWVHCNGEYLAYIDYRWLLNSDEDDDELNETTEESSDDEEEVDESYKLVVMECSKELYEKAMKEFGGSEKSGDVILPCTVTEREGQGRFADISEDTSSEKNEA